jgi:hypothetical protein
MMGRLVPPNRIVPILLAGVLSFAALIADAHSQGPDLSYDRKVDWNLPDRVHDAFQHAGLFKTYQLADAVNPFYLRGDFDGDSRPDYAVLIENRKLKHRAVAILLSSIHDIQILGLGGKRLRVGFGADSYLLDDFDWMDAWQIVPKQPLSKNELNEKVPAQMRGEGLLVEKTESAGAVIFWDGKQFRWYQTDD